MRRRVRGGAGRARPALALALALTAVAAVAAAAEEDAAPPPAAPDSWYARGAVAGLRAADATGGDGRAAGVAAANSALADGVRLLHGLAPSWLRRSEVDLRLAADDLRPRYDVTTVQPLYRSPSGLDTVFVQGRLASGAGEATAAAGEAALGYRRLLHGDRLLLGANGFYDATVPDGRRLGVGAEVRSRPLELRAAYYGDLPADGAEEAAAAAATGGAPDDAAAVGAATEVLAGYDVGVGAQLPYLPWARVYGERYWREAGALRAEAAGERFGLRLAPLPPVQVELGGESEAAAEPGYFARFRYTHVFGGTPERRAPLIDAYPLAFDDVSGRRLERIDR